jgi:hypothetical protein
VAADAVAPTITVTNPADADVAVPIDHTISATFSKAMHPATITNASFTLAIAGGGAAVNGTVAYDPASQIAIFTPSANLAPSTQYTATVSNTVTDLSGNALAAGLIPNPWSFTTGTVAGGGASPATINLGSAASFAVMATSSISRQRSPANVVWRSDAMNGSNLEKGSRAQYPMIRFFRAVHAVVPDGWIGQAN